jgi:hypothetical protein
MMVRAASHDPKREVRIRVRLLCAFNLDRQVPSGGAGAHLSSI